MMQKDIVNLKKHNKINEKLYEIIKIIKKLNSDDFNNFLNFFESHFTEKEHEIIKNEYALRNHDIKLAKSFKTDNSWLDEIYKDEISKLERLLVREDILEKIGGLKVLVYGETGTGKTSLINEIASRNKNYAYETLNLETIVSSKMGQTQINILKFADEVNEKAIKNKLILFFDELDSIVGSRLTEDLGERKKITGTFIKMLDKLDKKIVVFAATNYFSNLDESVLRRFNFKVQSKSITVDQFINFFDKSTNSTLLRKKTFLAENFKKSLTISDVNNFINHFRIEKEFHPNSEPFAEFLIFFDKYIDNKDKISERAKKMVKSK